MNPNNERRVFEVIVNTSSEELTSQYFLVTPQGNLSIVVCKGAIAPNFLDPVFIFNGFKRGKKYRGNTLRVLFQTSVIINFTRIY